MQNPKDGEFLWKRFSDAPQLIHQGDVARVSSHEHILVMECCEWNRIFQRFYSYDSRTDEWTNFVEYPIDEDSWHGIKFESPKIAIIPKTRKLHLNADNNAMRMFDMDTEIWTVVTEEWKELIVANPVVNANGIVHCVGALDRSDHCIYSDKERKWQCIHDFESAIVSIDRSYSMRHFSMIFVQSKQLILLIGVQDQGSSRRVGSLGSIWSFSTKDITENTWRLIEEVPFDFNRVSAVLTSDEQFVIISGGQTMSIDDAPQTSSKAIHVLDMRDESHFVLRQCPIQCPAFGECITMRTGSGLSLENQLFVVGWIRRLLQSEDMKHMQIPPDGVIRLIMQWYDNEMLHWIYCSSLMWLPRGLVAERCEPKQNENSFHFVIPMQSILESICS